jgi:hypothetical protein
MSKHTPGPWTQGVTLVTRDTRRWSADQIVENDARERGTAGGVDNGARR